MKRGIVLGLLLAIGIVLLASAPVLAQQPIVIKLGNVQATADIV